MTVPPVYILKPCMYNWSKIGVWERFVLHVSILQCRFPNCWIYWYFRVLPQIPNLSIIACRLLSLSVYKQKRIVQKQYFTKTEICLCVKVCHTTSHYDDKTTGNKMGAEGSQKSVEGWSSSHSNDASIYAWYFG